MTELLGPAQPWFGLLDAVGVLFVLNVWYVARGAGDRARAAAAAAGAAAFAMAVSAAANRIDAFVVWNSALAQVRPRPDLRTIAYALLGLAGVAAGALAVWHAHRAAAYAAGDLADDALVPEDDERDDDERDDDERDDDERDDDDYTLRRRRLVAFAPWIDLAALALALGLPVLAFGQADFPRASGTVTGWLVLFRVVNGVLLAGPLLLVTRRDDLRDARPVAAAFGVVAAGAVLRSAAPDVFANEWWASAASGLAVGLLAAAGFMLVRRAISDDRAAVVAGVLTAFAIGVFVSMLAGQVFADQQLIEQGPPGDMFGDFPGELEGEFPGFFTPPPG